MPVDYLTEEQEQRYGRYIGEPSREQLARYFHLDDEDRLLIAQRRGDHNRLGFGIQIGTLRFLGTFLTDPVNVPVGVIAYVASQLRITNPQCIVRYAERIQTQQDHAQEIRQHYSYKEFADRRGGFALMRFLYARAWVGTERPSGGHNIFSSHFPPARSRTGLNEAGSPVAWQQRKRYSRPFLLKK